jgi:hypothetical protein
MKMYRCMGLEAYTKGAAIRSVFIATMPVGSEKA